MDLHGSGLCLTDGTVQELFRGGTEENHENSQDSRSPLRYSMLRPTGYEAEMLTTHS
jgi:hypothetical protein